MSTVPSSKGNQFIQQRVFANDNGSGSDMFSDPGLKDKFSAATNQFSALPGMTSNTREERT